VRIDAHHHVWDLAVRDQPWTADIPALRRTFTFDQLRPQLVDAGISATVLVQTITVTEETPEFLALAERLRPACDRAPTAGCHRRGAPGSRAARCS
jgi:predicted TIM-barrel fold metal-dependent hydrolase